VALFAHGLCEGRKYDSFGVGYYYNAISNDLKNSIKRLTFNTASVNDEMGMEIFYLRHYSCDPVHSKLSTHLGSDCRSRVQT
jgi:hypothetical protein